MSRYRLFMFAVLQNKRLLSNLSFILVLIIIPLSVLGMNIFLKEQSGVFRIALCAEQKDDTAANKIINKLKSCESVLIFSDCGSEQEAIKMIETGDCDAAWIIKSDVNKRIKDYCSLKGRREPFLKILQRDESVTANLSCEKLYGTVFPDIIYATFEGYINENLSRLNLSDEEIRTIYDSINTDNSIISCEYLESSPEKKSDSFLLTPIRGILAVIVVLSGLAAQMVFLSDKKKGTYDWMLESKHIVIGGGITLVAVTDAVISAGLSMMLSGNSAPLKNEIISSLFLILVATSFCVLLGEIFCVQKALGISIPFIMLIMLLLSPIFVSIYPFTRFHFLFPPYYYLNSFYGWSYIKQSILYTAALFALSYGINLFKRFCIKRTYIINWISQNRHKKK